MYRTLYKTTGVVLVLALALAPGVIAQQQQHQEHHPDGALTSQGQRATTDEQEDDETSEQAPMMEQMQHMMRQMQGMMQQMRGMMGSGMMQRHFEHLAQQLGLSDEQRTQAQALLRKHTKEIIRLRADIDTVQIDMRQLLDADPVELPKVQQLLQTIAAKEAELRLSHITAMQEVRKLLTPEQQKKFRALQDSMMGDGGMMSPGGMTGPGGMRGREGMRGHGLRTQ